MPTLAADRPRNLTVTRVYTAPVELVWKAWTDPELVKRWWGPDYFTAPECRMDFREGGVTVVAMQAPEGPASYSTWTYRKIVPLQEIEYVQAMSDAAGQPVDPTTLGLPPDFPLQTRTVVTFRTRGDQWTEMTVTEYDFTAEGQMYEFAIVGLHQVVDKLGAVLKNP
ncbi:MAG: SRPBCC domain-containing protein [Anaerolineales bacterium]|nr:SRPBCC domain-containing protein [Anaerolineales bacterium]